MTWRDRAACIGMDAAVFYPHAIQGIGYGNTDSRSGGALTKVQREHVQRQERPAKAICAGCEVRAACLEYAVRTGQRDGIWGGMNAREREKLRRAQEVGR